MKGEWRVVVIVSRLAVVDEPRHHLAGDRGILELIARRADCHIEAWHLRFVVDRDPIVCNIVEVDHTFHLIGNSKRRNALGIAVDLNGRLVGEVLIVVVGIDPVARVAFRVLAAEQNVVAVLGPTIDADIAVGGYRCSVVIGITIRCRNVHDFLLQRACLKSSYRRARLPFR